jgi:hypothetical protein
MLTRTGRERPTLADVDGTVKGKVQLMSVKLVDGLSHDTEHMCTYIEEGEYDEDPWTFAMGLMRGIEKDWPDHEWAIVGNWRARYLRWAATMPAFLPGPHTPEAYLATFRKET